MHLSLTERKYYEPDCSTACWSNSYEKKFRWNPPNTFEENLTKVESNAVYYGFCFTAMPVFEIGGLVTLASGAVVSVVHSAVDFALVTPLSGRDYAGRQQEYLKGHYKKLFNENKMTDDDIRAMIENDAWGTNVVLELWYSGNEYIISSKMESWARSFTHLLAYALLLKKSRLRINRPNGRKYTWLPCCFKDNEGLFSEKSRPYRIESRDEKLREFFFENFGFKDKSFGRFEFKDNGDLQVWAPYYYYSSEHYTQSSQLRILPPGTFTLSNTWMGRAPIVLECWVVKQVREKFSSTGYVEVVETITMSDSEIEQIAKRETQKYFLFRGPY
jgi:hypothetical protein